MSADFSALTPLRPPHPLYYELYLLIDDFQTYLRHTTIESPAEGNDFFIFPSREAHFQVSASTAGISVMTCDMTYIRLDDVIRQNL